MTDTKRKPLVRRDEVVIKMREHARRAEIAYCGDKTFHWHTP